MKLTKKQFSDEWELQLTWRDLWRLFRGWSIEVVGLATIFAPHKKRWLSIFDMYHLPKPPEPPKFDPDATRRFNEMINAHFLAAAEEQRHKSGLN